MGVRLDDIDYFLAVADHGGVRRAAAAIGVSQPAITQGLQRLEKELGFRLFDRSATGMQLTTVAQQFRDRTKALRGSLDEAIKEAADLHLGEMGVLRVGVSPLYVQRLFVPAALELHRQRPAARIRVMLGLNDLLASSLRLGDIDLSVGALPGVMPADLVSVPLIEDVLCLVVREHHPLLRRSRLRLRDLADVQWLLPGQGVSARRSLDGRLADAGLPPAKVAVEFNNATWGQFNPLVAGSDLVAIASESILESAAGKGLVALPLADGRFARTIGALLRKGAVRPPLVLRFLELLQAARARGGPRKP